MIQCVCLNPAVQRTLTINNLQVNAVNRATHVTESVGGKGVNVSRVLKTLGQPSVVTGFVGGDTGVLARNLLDQEGITHDFVTTVHKTRTCITILDQINHTHTELVEEGKSVTSAEMAEMYQVYERHLQSCQLVVISGTTPAGVPEDVYYQLITLAQAQNIPVLLDTQKQWLLQALKAKPFLVKINREELMAAFQQTDESPTILQHLIRQLLQEGVEWAVITHRDEETLLTGHHQQWTIVPPKIIPVNPIGSGDAMLAGIAAALLQQQSLLQAVCLGTACGSANALTLTPGVIKREDVERLLLQI